MQTKHIFLVLLCLGLALGSCRKKSDPTPAERLRASAWRATGLAINGVSQPAGSLRLTFTETGFSGTLADGTPVAGT
jgi:hypothetical protein